MRFGILGAVMIGLSCSPAPEPEPEASYGWVAGRVLDGETGEPIAAAEVDLDGLPREGLTDDDGYFEIDSVPDGVYFLGASAHGYYFTHRPDARVIANDTLIADFELNPRPVELEPED